MLGSMVKYQLKYRLKVHDSKYRELLNVLERKMRKPPWGELTDCTAFQAINDMHIFEYLEVWTELESLKKYLNSDEFKSIDGAFQLLTIIEDFSITESVELENIMLQ